MKILMLTPYLPYPPSSGGQVRSFNLIKNLSYDHQITLFSLIKEEGERLYIKNLKKFCNHIEVFKRAQNPWTISNILATGISLYPFLVIRNFSSEEKQRISQLLKKEKFDIIHAETFYVSPHIPQTNIPIILVDQTIEYQVYQHYVENFKWKILKPFLFIDVLKIKYWEIYYWKKAAKVIAVSETDACSMRQLVAGLKADVVPNGVGEDLAEDVPLHFCEKILFMGNYAWLQNVEAAKILAKEVFPKILQRVPAASLVIAGQHTDKIKNLQTDKVTILNLGIEDIEGVQKAYRISGILLAPLYGPGGTRLKILGAMAAKLPVVTTSIGIEGIDAIQGKSVLYGDTPEQLANLTIKLLKDKDLYKKIALGARKLIEEKYTYERISKKLSDIYNQAVAENRNLTAIVL